MKKLCISGGSPVLLDVPKPELKPNTVLVKTMYSFVSRGTELATIKQNKNSLFNKVVGNAAEVGKKITSLLQDKGLVATFYQIKSQLLKKLEVGYASSGVVVASASKAFREGDLVACAGAGIATHSEYCLAPTTMLARLILPSSNLDGAKLPNFSTTSLLKNASITPIAAIALQSLRRANLQMGESVCVVGLGLLGLLTVQLAKIAGLKVIGIDPDSSRQELALRLGANKAFASSDEWVATVMLYANKLGVDATILTAGGGDEKLLDQAINVTRKKGKVVVVGDVKLSFSREAFYQKELDLLISTSYGPGRYDPTYEEQCTDYPYAFVRWTQGRNLQYIADLIASQRLLIEPLISGVFPLNKAQEAYDLLSAGGLGVIFDYTANFTTALGRNNATNDLSPNIKNNNEQADFSSAQNQIFTTAILTVPEPTSNKTKVNVALIGAGGFAKTILVPIIKCIKSINLAVVTDPNPLATINFQETFGFISKTGNFTEALADESIDLFILTTPDEVHCTQALCALRQNKAVFVEKPMLKNWDEFTALQSFLHNNPQSFLAVDFNRSYAPMVAKIIPLVQNRVTPLLINYRVNAGMTGQFESGRPNNLCRRLVGEICHFFELFLLLVGKRPIKMTALFSDGDKIALEENLSLILLFEDGSIANLLYTSLASNKLGKERGEFFWDGKAAVLDDYKSLVGYGLERNFDEYSLVPDKGHGNLLSTFVCAVQKKQPQVFAQQWPRYFMATWLSLKLEELLLKNGGTINIDPECAFNFDQC